MLYLRAGGLSPRVRVLALDTSTELGSVAILVDGTLRAEIGARVRTKHGETLLPLVRRALGLAGLSEASLDLIATGLGPGSFTGTRVGVATAKGLALALGCPLVGVVSLRAIARGAPARLVAPAVDAHKGEVYVALYEQTDAGLREHLAPAHAPPAEAVARLREARPAGVEGWATGGSGVRRYPEALAALGARVLPPVFDGPRAAVLAQEAIERFEAGGPDDLAALEPLYVRPSDATLPAGAPAKAPKDQTEA
ncbi:MAG TPA: tRNA (adenosine(37)-N6)-threonylcarbamoyltransferase complex dimerization subunit type 1 TsaB [Sandaracinaceae bacterium LLY-WYZ-13_1]|nr:tRNA (adenosine(37)-N6)-threonylcarbamoyltransferase complex dimerization subunit type 1 TsaB [Sandaracinaceae bacterium LLY-WYZ-13_1]